ncbi:MAG TPA: ECF transporter S component [Alloiococcus sp.]|nr:ECF transporter S component [Alloiococcus sp.]
MTKQRETNQTKRLAKLGIITAILLIQNFVPLLGNLPIPPLNPTIIHVTVIVTTILMGTKDGMLAGFIWGIIRLFRAFAMPATPLDPLLWVNPFISVLPRVLIGLTTGFIFYMLSKKFPDSKLRISIAAFVGSLTNTIFVMIFIYIFFNAEVAHLMNIDMSNIAYGLMAIIVTSGIPEALVAAFLTPLIVKPLQKL